MPSKQMNNQIFYGTSLIKTAFQSLQPLLGTVAGHYHHPIHRCFSHCCTKIQVIDDHSITKCPQKIMDDLVKYSSSLHFWLPYETIT